MKIKNSQKGFAFVEILASLAILGAITTAFFGGMATTFKAVMISQQTVVADRLNKSQAEYIKSQSYIAVADYNPNDPTKRYELIDIPANLVAAGYSVNIGIPQAVISGVEEEIELQSVKIMTQRNDQGILSFEIYRLDG